MPIDAVLSYELATSMSELSREMGRSLGVLVDRRGLIQWVIVGHAGGISLPDLGRHRAGQQRLRGLRLIHTHLQPGGLNREDLTDLSKLHLDLICAVDVLEDGRAGQVHMGHLVPPNPEGELWHIMEPKPAYRLGVDFSLLVRSLEDELARKSLMAGAGSREGAILVHVQVSGDRNAEESLHELEMLADTAKVDVLDTVMQKRPAFDPRYVVGKGKLEELVLRALQLDVDMIVFDHDLSPAQTRAISDFTDLKVIDRTQLILDIFAQRAVSNEGKLQVELAQLKYILPRLAGRYGAMIRQAGGIGTRGPGEKKIEVDRRRMRDRITKLEQDINELARRRENRRSLRRKREIPIIAIVGYTNAGKSTLLNALTKSSVLAEDKLFATLDPTTRRLRFPQDREVILADTVGFIRDLPKDLVNAFRATLEELQDADLLIHLIDATDPDMEERKKHVELILDDLDLLDKRRIVVFNKIDLLDSHEREGVCRMGDEAVSARDVSTFEHMLHSIEEILWQDSLRVTREAGKNRDADCAEHPFEPCCVENNINMEVMQDHTV